MPPAIAPLGILGEPIGLLDTRDQCGFGGRKVDRLEPRPGFDFSRSNNLDSERTKLAVEFPYVQELIGRFVVGLAGKEGLGKRD